MLKNFIERYLEFRQRLFETVRNPIKIKNNKKNLMLLNFIKFNSEQFFLLRLIILIILLYFLFKDIYYNRYLISLLIFFWILLYNMLYKLLNVYDHKVKDFFFKYKKLNNFFIIIYFITNVFYWFYLLETILLHIKKIFSFCLLKVHLLKFEIWVVNVIYYILYNFLFILFIKISSWKIKIKKKIIEKTIKELIDWRLLVLSLNILIIQQLLYYFELKINILFLVLIIVFIVCLYLIDQSILKLYNEKTELVNFKQAFYYLIIINAQAKHINYLKSSLLYTLLSSRLFFNTYYLRKNNKWLRKRIHSYFLDKVLIKTVNICVPTQNDIRYEGYDLLNRYWLNRDLYYDEILFGIDIGLLSEFFFFYNKNLLEKFYIDWLKILYEKEEYLIDNKQDFFVVDEVVINFEQKKIYSSNELINFYTWHTYIKNNQDINHIWNIYTEIEKSNLKILELLNLLLSKNNQNLRIKINYLLDNHLVDANLDNYCFYEYIWLDFELDNKNVKYVNYFEKKIIEKNINNEIDKIISNMNKILELKKKINSILFLSNITIPGPCGYRVIPKSVYDKSPPPVFDTEEEEDLFWFEYDSSNYDDYLKYEKLNINELKSITMDRVRGKIKKDIEGYNMLYVKEKIKKEKTVELSYTISGKYKKSL